MSSYLKILNNFSLYLIYLLPAALVTGSFLPDLIISFSSLIFLFIIIIKKKKYFHNYLSYFFVIFWLILIISSFLSKNSLFSLETSFFYIRFFIFSLLIYYLLVRGLFNFKIFTNLLLLTILLLIFDSHFQYFVGYNILGYKLESALRVSSFFGNELKMGSFLFRIFPILLVFLFFFNKKKLYLFLIPAVFSSIILSGERASIILSIIFFLGTLILKIKFKEKILIIFSLFLVITIQYLFNDSFRYNFSERMKEEFVFEKLDKTADTKEKKFRFKFFTSMHSEMYNTSYEMFLDKKILGHGPRMYRIICKEYDVKTCSTHPHSFALQLLAETGIVGFLFYMTFFFFIIKEILYSLLLKSKNSNYVIILTLIIFINLFPLAPSGNFFNNWLNIIMYLPLGFYFFFRKKINI